MRLCQTWIKLFTAPGRGLRSRRPPSPPTSAMRPSHWHSQASSRWPPAHSARAPRTPPLKSALGRTCISSSGPWMPGDGRGCGSGSGFGGAGVCLGTGSGTTSAALWKSTSTASDVGPGSATSCDLLFLIQTSCSAAPPALSPLASSADPDFSFPASQPRFSLIDQASHGSE